MQVRRGTGVVYETSIVEGRVDLRTDYMGLKLAHPFIVGASPLADDVDTARQLEDAGAAAIVMRSLFAEQIVRESLGAYLHPEERPGSWAASSGFVLPSKAFVLSPDAYLEQLSALKAALDIPVIASLNGSEPGRWLDYAPIIESVGADAIELNLQPGGAAVARSSAEIEADLLETVRAARRLVKIPIAVKLPPYFSGLAVLAEGLQQAGAGSLVLFHRAAASDIDPASLVTVPPLQISRAAELPLRLRWLAILSCRLRIPLAASGGVHDELGAVKALMAGARVVQMVSAILARGPERLREVRKATEDWMQRHAYPSIGSMRGSMDLEACPDTAAYERATSILALQRWPTAE
jgi:dihydroorotate dehydrogenase (fumarate)